MRRDMRRNQNDDNFDTKKILYITGAIFVLAIIIFAIVFYMYNKQWNEDYEEIGQINSIAEDYEETSSSFGKTVKEEAKNPVFQMPVEGEIVKKFAKTNLVYSNTLGEWVTHNGIDIKADKTTVVKASESGTVKSIKNDPRYGLTIIIEHTNDYTTVYSNLLSTEFVVVGEKVEKGQTIGTVGNTATFEIADEPHLHFEILHNSENLDPELYFK